MIPAVTHSILGVQPANIGNVWPMVEPLLRKAMRFGHGETLESIQDKLVSGHVQLWVIDHFLAIVGTSVVTRPDERLLFVDFLSGLQASNWIDDLTVVLEAFAISHQCSAIEFRGRRGWKLFERRYRDYKPLFTIYRKEL